MNSTQLKAKIDELQQTLDSEQGQIADAIAKLESTVTDLRAQIASGTPEDLQPLADQIDGILTDLKGTVTVAPTEPQTPPTEPETPTTPTEPTTPTDPIPA